MSPTDELDRCAGVVTWSPRRFSGSNHLNRSGLSLRLKLKNLLGLERNFTPTGFLACRGIFYFASSKKEILPAERIDPGKVCVYYISNFFHCKEKIYSFALKFLKNLLTVYSFSFILKVI